MYKDKYKIIKAIQDGNKSLLNDFIKENFNYITGYTMKYKNIYSDYDELVQEAVIIFIKCINNYNFKNDFYQQFTNIRLYVDIRKYVLNNLDRVTDDEEKYNLCVKMYERFIRKYIDSDELYSQMRASLGIESRKVDEIIDIATLSEYNFYKEEQELNSNIEDKYLEKIEHEKFLDKYINNTLTETQKKIILFKYGFINNKCYRFSELAFINGISKNSVYLDHKYAIKKLKKRHGKELQKLY